MTRRNAYLWFFRVMILLLDIISFSVLFPKNIGVATGISFTISVMFSEQIDFAIKIAFKEYL